MLNCDEPQKHRLYHCMDQLCPCQWNDLTFDTIQNAIAKMVGNGFTPTKAYVNPKTFANLASDMAALRRFNHIPTYHINSRLTFLTLAGMVEVIPNPMIRENVVNLI
jgi:hypothetical protein